MEPLIKNRYRQLRLLGKGGMGEVWLVEDQLYAARLLALKKVPLAPKNRQLLSQFLELEFLTLSTLRHPNIAAVYDCDSDGDTLFFTSEYIDGLDMQQYFAQPRELSQLIEAVVQIARALDYLHTHGYQHHDIKPNNILILASPLKIKLLDFGAARLAQSTSLMARVATPRYTAPEILAGEAGDARADLYSLGITLQEVLTENFTNVAEDQIPLLNALEELARNLTQRQAERRPHRASKIIDWLKDKLGPAWVHEDPAALLSYAVSAKIIGRQTQLGQLDSLIENLHQPHWVEICAPFGTGKSRLLLELRRHWQSRSLAWIAINAQASASLIPPWLAHLRSLGAAPATPQILANPDLLTTYLIDTALAVAQQQKLVLSIDDMQLASHLDQRIFTQWMAALANQANPPPILVLVASEPTQPAAWQESLALWPTEAKHNMSLLGLSTVAEVQSFVASTLGLEQTPEPFATALLKKSGGNFYLLEETLKSILTSRPNIQMAELTSRLLDDLKIANSLHRFIDNRLSNLDETDRQLLTRLALVGGSAKQELLTQLISDLPDHPRRLEPLRQQGWIRFDHGAVRVSEALVGTKLRDRLTPTERTALHRIVADALLADNPSLQRTPNVAWLLHRILGDESQPPDELLQQVEHLMASPLLLEELEQREALALTLSRTIKAPEERAKWQIHLADLYLLQGKSRSAKLLLEGMLANQRRYYPIYLRLAQLARKRGDVPLLQRCHQKILKLKHPDEVRWQLELWLAEAQLLQGEWLKGIASLQKLSRHLGERPTSLRPALANALGYAYLSVQRYDEALHWLKQAERQSHNSAQELATALYRQGMVQARRAQPTIALKQLLEAKRIASTTGSVSLLTSIELNLGALYQTTGDLTAAIVSYHEGGSAAARSQDPTNLTVSHINLATLLHFLGDWPNAKRHLSEANRLSQSLAQPFFVAYAQLLSAVMRRELGDPLARRELLTCLRAFRKLKSPQEQILAMLELGKFHWHQGKSRRAHHRFKRCRTLLGETPNAQLNLTAQFYQLLLAPSATGWQELIDDLSDEGSLESQDLLWQAYYQMSRHLQTTAAAQGAIFSLRQARDHFQKLLKRIPAAYQQGFIQAPTRQPLLESIERELGSVVQQDLSGKNLSVLSRVLTQVDDKLGPLMEISRKLNSMLDLPALLEVILEVAMGLTEAEHAHLLTLGSNGLTTSARRNLTEEESHASTTIAKMVMASGKPFLSQDAQSDERLRGVETVVDWQLKSVLCLPFILRDQIIGVLYLEHRSKASAFNPNLVRLVEAIVDQAAIALHNARLHTELMEKERRIRELNRQLKRELEAERLQLAEVNRRLSADQQQLLAKYRTQNIITRNKKMRQLLEVVEKVAQSDVAVVIHGESGTGKELIARAIHFNGVRKNKPFLTINCSALAENLLESELFGHERGSFTGANTLKRGLFEAANGGTLFLDEVADMSLAMQVKLLRTLQEGEIRRVGGTEQIKVDVRIVSASHFHLGERVKMGTFREDLFYRLNTIELEVPPLRQRRDDIPLLLAYFIEQSARPDLQIKAATLDLLTRYRWPGNVRELENEVARLMIFAGSEITPAELSATIRDSAQQHDSLLNRGHEERLKNSNLAQLLHQAEKELLTSAMELYEGKKGVAAQKLGVTRFTLYRKLKEHGLDQEHSLEKEE